MKIDVMLASGPTKRKPKTEPVFPEAPETKTEDSTKTSDDFKTPEQIAAADDIALEAGPPVAAAVEPEANERAVGNWRSKLAVHWPPRKKEYLIGIVVIVLLIGGVSSALVPSRHKQETAVLAPRLVIKKPNVVVAPTTVASTLTGLPVAPAVNQQPVTAVMVENSLDARPQSGLGQAGVVFEAIAEGGVTRFMALFQDTAPDNVGPIRSARPYYVAWSQAFDAGYAHVGGSPDGLADIRAWGVRDLDQFANSGAYHRINTRDAPHNVYTGIPTLNQLEVAKGYGTSTYTGFLRKVAAPSAAPTAKTINFALSGYYYNPHFDYNAATNSYNRSEAAAPQLDQNTGQQLSPKVVVALVTPLGQGDLDSSGAYYSNYTVTGSGVAYIFQDGVVATGHWNKADNKTQISFTDDAGKPLGLNPGQTWLTAVNSASAVTYAP